ncbi:hypothetical protein BDP27DRAFT_1426669 [Rhodocollybia butyracea]|uniref:Uncharacterized protein n=1 Tax=Rhodocollybia butyracea TaxID=206335 RepID=A0A9P5PHU8_9AGAR|nr:hypothetical protein BDP27DRAFT_1426669 [Rhodocollybia butyracea]
MEPLLGSIETPALDLPSDPIPSLPSHIVALVALNSFRDYVMYSFGNDTTTAMYPWEGGTRRKLWFGIQNHREVCVALKLAGFSDLSALDGTFRLPNGKSLTLREILSSELGWDPATFKRKLGHYDWCLKFALSHQWKFESLPAPDPPSLGTPMRRKWDEKCQLLKTWKGIVAMFLPNGFASSAAPPTSYGDYCESLAAELTENRLTKRFQIIHLLTRRRSNVADSWF